MKKKIIGMIAAVVIVLGLSLVVYNQMMRLLMMKSPCIYD